MSETLPSIGIKTKWPLGTNYKTEMDENLALIDALLQCGVIDRDLSAPPGSPANGDSYIVGASPTGAWSSKANQIAVWNTVNAAWAFYAPKEGWRCFVKDEDEYVSYLDTSSWKLDQEFGFHLQVSNALRSYVIIDIADADYTLTLDEAIAGFKFIVNSGTTQRTITVPTVSDGICGTASVYSLVYCGSNLEIVSESGGTSALILAHTASEEVIYGYGVLATPMSESYVKKANSMTNGYVAETSTAYAPTLDDLGRIISMNHASASTLTLSTEATAGWYADCKLIIRSGGAGGLTIAGSGGVTLVGVTALTTDQIVTAYYTGSDTWVIG
jgi:hypothetical protein